MIQPFQVSDDACCTTHKLLVCSSVILKEVELFQSERGHVTVSGKLGFLMRGLKISCLSLASLAVDR